MSPIPLQSLPTVESVVVASVLVAPGFIATTMALSLSGGFLNRDVDTFVLLLWSLISSLLIDAVYFATGGNTAPITDLLDPEQADVGTALSDLSAVVLVLFGLSIVLGAVYAVVLVYDLPDRLRAVLWKSRQIKRSPESPWLNHLRDADRVLVELDDGEQFYGNLRYYSTDGDPRREIRINRPQRRGGWGENWQEFDLTGNADGFSLLLSAENIEKIVGYPKIDSFAPLRDSASWLERLREDSDYVALCKRLEPRFTWDEAGALVHELVYKNNFRWEVALMPFVAADSPDGAGGTLVAASRGKSDEFEVGAVVEATGTLNPAMAYTVVNGDPKSLVLGRQDVDDDFLEKFQWLRDLLADLEHVTPASKFTHRRRFGFRWLSEFARERRLGFWWPSKSVRKHAFEAVRTASYWLRYSRRTMAYPFEKRERGDGTAVGTVARQLRVTSEGSGPSREATDPVNSVWFGFGRTEHVFETRTDGDGDAESDAPTK